MAKVMNEDKKAMSRELNAEMRRQLGGTQMRRFCASLPAFQHAEEMPGDFDDLLRKLDGLSKASPPRYRQ